MTLEKTIVHVENDSDLRELVKDYFSLKLPNVRLVQVSNLRDFKRWHLSNTSTAGDLYICDGSFPERPGEDDRILWPKVAGIVSLIKKFDLYPTIGMILTSDSSHDTKKYEPLTIVQVMQKPFQCSKLFSAVEKHLYGR
jgi:hypothetical protein